MRPSVSLKPVSGPAGLRPDGHVYKTGLKGLFTTGLDHADQGGSPARSLSHAPERRTRMGVVGDLGLTLKALGLIKMIGAGRHGRRVYRR